MKTLLLSILALTLSHAAVAAEFLPLRDALGAVADEHFGGIQPRHPFTLARDVAIKAEWRPVNADLQKRYLRAMGNPTKQFVPFSKATWDEEGMYFKGPDGKGIDVISFYVQYISKDVLEISVSEFGGPLSAWCVTYRVTRRDGKFELVEIANIES